MECPHCKKELRIHENSHPFANVDIYGGFSKGKTTCCNKVVSVGRIIKFDVIASYGSVDDWGN